MKNEWANFSYNVFLPQSILFSSLKSIQPKISLELIVDYTGPSISFSKMSAVYGTAERNNILKRALASWNPTEISILLMFSKQHQIDNNFKR
jgi:hypothetical protein